MPLSEEDLIEEQIHFSNVVATFEQYAKYALSANNRRRKDLFTLPPADQAILEDIGWKGKLIDIDNAILANARFLSQMVTNPEIFMDRPPGHDGEEIEQGRESNDLQPQQHRGTSETHSSPSAHSRSFAREHNHGQSHVSPSHSHGHNVSPPVPASGRQRSRYRPTEADMDKLRSTLKQFVRDWSTEGKDEREACYVPMKEALVKHFVHVPLDERANIRVLVPGAGLGRLAYDVAHLGFSCQGNEFSQYMLIASNFILNRTAQVNQHIIYPHVHSLSNIPNRDALLRAITIPDVFPSDIPSDVDFSYVAGDFEEVYGAEEGDGSGHESQSGQWDAVLTCFFIDTAKNVINYLRIIHKILAPGGVWINLGPLLWHWENNTTNDPSIELDLEEVKLLCRKLGFKLENEKTIETPYTNNDKSLLQYMYRTSFWTATRAQEQV